MDDGKEDKQWDETETETAKKGWFGEVSNLMLGLGWGVGKQRLVAGVVGNVDRIWTYFRLFVEDFK